MSGFVPLLGLLDVTERGGRLVAQLPVTHWPVTIGRSLAADLVIDDPHLAPEHLRIARDESGQVRVEVLDTANGIRQKRQDYRRGEQFEWQPGQPLALGRLHFALRLADQPLAPEQPLPRFAWSSLLVTLGLIFVLLGLELAALSLQAAEPSAFARQLPAGALAIVGSLLLWGGLWALATKIFSGRLQFWRHVRVAAGGFIASRVIGTLAHLAAFAFSWENLARFDSLLLVLVGSATVFLHLAIIAPQRRGLLAGLLAGALLLGIPAVLGTQWLQNKRLSGNLYLSSLFPPAWRIAPTVPVSQFLQEAQSLKQKLDERVQDKEDEDRAEDEAEAE